MEFKKYLLLCLAVSVLTVGTVALVPGASENIEQRLLAFLSANARGG
jgi:hypothetical protein